MNGDRKCLTHGRRNGRLITLKGPFSLSKKPKDRFCLQTSFTHRVKTRKPKKYYSDLGESLNTRLNFLKSLLSKTRSFFCACLSLSINEAGVHLTCMILV